MGDYKDDYASEDDAEPAQSNQSKSWITFVWIFTPMGLLKIAQFGTLLMGLILIGSKSTGERISMEFFVFVCTAAWVFVFIRIVLNILNVYDQLPAVLTNNFVLCIGCAVGAAVLLIGSATMMGRNKEDDTVLTAGSFGLITMFLLIFEMVFHFVQYKRAVKKDQELMADSDF